MLEYQLWTHQLQFIWRFWKQISPFHVWKQSQINKHCPFDGCLEFDQKMGSCQNAKVFLLSVCLLITRTVRFSHLQSSSGQGSMSAFWVALYLAVSVEFKMASEHPWNFDSSGALVRVYCLATVWPKPNHMVNSRLLNVPAKAPWNHFKMPANYSNLRNLTNILKSSINAPLI